MMMINIDLSSLINSLAFQFAFVIIHHTLSCNIHHLVFGEKHMYTDGH